MIRWLRHPIVVLATVAVVAVTPVPAWADDPPAGGQATMTGDTPDLDALREQQPSEIVAPADPAASTRDKPAEQSPADCTDALSQPADQDTVVGCVRRVPTDPSLAPPQPSMAEAPSGVTALAAADWNVQQGPVPRWCDVNRPATYQRLRECHADTFLFTVYRRPENIVLGEAWISYWEWEELSNKRRTWTHTIQMYVYRVTGLAVLSTYLNAQGWCGLNCDVATPAETRYIRLEEGQWLRGAWDMGRPGGADERKYGSADTDLTFLHLETGITRTWTSIDFQNRCDSEMPETPLEGGCVYNEVQPELALDKSTASNHREHALFVEQAQHTTPDHFGARHLSQPGEDPKPLQRLTDQDRRDDNREASCDDFVRDPAVPDDSCDEYPYASTYQGANEIGRARTAVGHVPRQSNTNGGSKLTAFYTANRVLDGDPFWVAVVDGPVGEAPGRDMPPEVYAGEDVIGFEGAELDLRGSAEDAQGPPAVHWSYTPRGPVDPGTICTFGDPDRTATTFVCNDDGSFTVTLTADDGVNTPVSDELVADIRNVGPRIRRALPDFAPRAATEGASLLRPEPWSTHRAGEPVQLTAPYADPGGNDTQTCVVLWDDGTEDRYPAQNSNCDRPHTYSHAGMDTIAVTITDDDGDSETSHSMIVVYDPDGGFATTGAWLDSPAGALTAKPTATGRLHVTLNPMYKPDETGPAPGGGKVSASLDGTDFALDSTALEWLVVTRDAKVAVKGTATVNGQAGYGFVAYGTDDPDKLRLVVWPLSAGNHPGEDTLYDNRPLGDYDLDLADPQPLGAGSVQVHE
ncbi:NucA/NucB deoxyribonuclease domain-containing protein [Micromonospora sp. NPDC003776]